MRLGANGDKQTSADWGRTLQTLGKKKFPSPKYKRRPGWGEIVCFTEDSSRGHGQERTGGARTTKGLAAGECTGRTLMVHPGTGFRGGRRRDVALLVSASFSHPLGGLRALFTGDTPNKRRPTAPCSGGKVLPTPALGSPSFLSYRIGPGTAPGEKFARLGK